MFLIDDSASVGEKGFQAAKEYIKKVIMGLNIGENKTQVSLVSFNKEVTVHFKFGEHTTKENVSEAIDKVG